MIYDELLQNIIKELSVLCKAFLGDDDFVLDNECVIVVDEDGVQNSRSIDGICCASRASFSVYLYAPNRTQLAALQNAALGVLNAKCGKTPLRLESERIEKEGKGFVLSLEVEYLL